MSIIINSLSFHLIGFIILTQDIKMTLNSKRQHQNNPPPLQQQISMFTEPLQFQKRRCTDIFCIYVFVSFFLICVCLSFGLKNRENELKIKYPSDTDGKVCGIDYPVFKKIYFTNLPEINQRVCVAACPRVQDIKISCMPTSYINCTFSQTVRFTETLLQSNQNGKLCMPVEPKIKNTLIRSLKLQSRVSLSNRIILLIIQITVALSIISLILLNYCPTVTMETVQYLSLIFEILLGMLVYILQTQHVFAKYLTLFLLSAAFLLTMSQILIFRQELRLNRVFLLQSSKFMSLNKSLTSYIVIFEVILFCFLQFLLTMYNNLLSAGKISFDPERSLYYTAKSVDNSTIVIMVVFGVWGISIIQQLYKFFISAHTINWYLQLPNNFGSIKYTFILLLHKHIGTVIASAFINGFLFIPQMVFDLLPICKSNKQTTNNCLFKCLDLVRADTLAFVILAGLPFCNSSRYCDYFWSQTMISQKNQSTGHMLIASIGSIIFIFIKEEVDAYLLVFTLIIGLLVSTFFVDFNAICAQTLQLLYIMEQEFSKRPEGQAKVIMNFLCRADQRDFLNNATDLYKNQEVGQQLAKIKKVAWKLETHQKVYDRKQSIQEKQKSYNKQIQNELILITQQK